MHPTAQTVSDRTDRIALRPGEGVAGVAFQVLTVQIVRATHPVATISPHIFLTFVSLQEPSRLHSSPLTLRTYLFPICGEDYRRMANFHWSFIECLSDGTALILCAKFRWLRSKMFEMPPILDADGCWDFFEEIMCWYLWNSTKNGHRTLSLFRQLDHVWSLGLVLTTDMKKISQTGTEVQCFTKTFVIKNVSILYVIVE